MPRPRVRPKAEEVPVFHVRLEPLDGPTPWRVRLEQPGSRVSPPSWQDIWKRHGRWLVLLVGVLVVVVGMWLGLGYRYSRRQQGILLLRAGPCTHTVRIVHPLRATVGDVVPVRVTLQTAAQCAYRGTLALRPEKADGPFAAESTAQTVWQVDLPPASQHTWETHFHLLEPGRLEWKMYLEPHVRASVTHTMVDGEGWHDARQFLRSVLNGSTLLGLLGLLERLWTWWRRMGE